MANSDQNRKEFLLAQYQQVGEFLRTSDRNRDIWVGAYFAFLVGGLSVVDKVGADARNVLLAALFVFGVVVAFYTTIARAWHCEYNRVLMAIHKSFADEKLDPLSSAEELKQSGWRPFSSSYFNPKGTEFAVYSLVLLALCLLLALLLYPLFMWLSFVPVLSLSHKPSV